MRTVYDAWREHDRYEDMSEFDKFLVDEYEAEKYEAKADEQEDEDE
jgi:hypothetical protein